MLIVRENKIGEPSSNSRLVYCVHFRKDTNAHLLSLSLAMGYLKEKSVAFDKRRKTLNSSPFME